MGLTPFGVQLSLEGTCLSHTPWVGGPLGKKPKSVDLAALDLTTVWLFELVLGLSKESCKDP